MKWTRESPRVEGWYWYKTPHALSEPIVVNVGTADNQLVIMQEDAKGKTRYLAVADIAAAWSDGPIPEPEPSDKPLNWRGPK
jgi:hypothetical protein